MIEKLLAHLERYDTYQAEDALRLAMQATLGSGPGSEAAQAIWANWVETPNGEKGWDALVDMAEARLNYWHSIKYNALETAWNFDPSGQDVPGMIKAVLIALRQGINDHPNLLADAHFMQALAKAGHNFSFTQALKELRMKDLQLPGDDKALLKHCLVCAKSFEILIAAG